MKGPALRDYVNIASTYARNMHDIGTGGYSVKDFGESCLSRKSTVKRKKRSRRKKR